MLCGMNTTQMLKVYADRAKAANCPTWRTVNMLGMMCAGAVESGRFVAFTGQGLGSDWPDPRMPVDFGNSSMPLDRRASPTP